MKRVALSVQKAVDDGNPKSFPVNIVVDGKPIRVRMTLADFWTLSGPAMNLELRLLDARMKPRAA